MGVRNHIDGKGFWTEHGPEGPYGTTVVTISGSVNQSDGSFSYQSPMVSVTAGTNILTISNIRSDSFVMANAIAGAISIYLPQIPSDGYRITIKKIDQSSNIVTIFGSTISETIDGQDSKIITQAYSSLRLVSHNGKWWIF